MKILVILILIYFILGKADNSTYTYNWERKYYKDYLCTTIEPSVSYSLVNKPNGYCEPQKTPCTICGVKMFCNVAGKTQTEQYYNSASCVGAYSTTTENLDVCTKDGIYHYIAKCYLSSVSGSYLPRLSIIMLTMGILLIL